MIAIIRCAGEENLHSSQTANDWLTVAQIMTNTTAVQGARAARGSIEATSNRLVTPEEREWVKIVGRDRRAVY